MKPLEYIIETIGCGLFLGTILYALPVILMSLEVTP